MHSLIPTKHSQIPIMHSHHDRHIKQIYQEISKTPDTSQSSQYPYLNITGSCTRHVFDMEVIFNEMEVTSLMQRINSLKYNRHQTQLPEYRKKDIHKVKVTANSDSVNLMRIKSNISDKVFTLHLEFTDDSTGIGEEIRDTLKERYLQQELKSGSGQSEPTAIQSPSPKGETEERDI